jgi:hypothetical protein
MAEVTTGVGSLNAALGSVRDTQMNQMKELLNSKEDAGIKSGKLLDAQAALGITDGVQNILSKAYNRWQQTGQ